MSHFVLFHWIMIQIFIAVHTASETVVRGVIGQPVTLPCSYRVSRAKDISDMCWGRGPCPNSKCSNKLLHTTGRRVTFRTSQRYDLQGYISYGDVSLTIQEVTAEDAGTYCCRVEIPGWFNDIKQNIRLLVLRATNNVKKKTTKNGSKSTKHSRKTTFAPQTTSDLQRTVQTAIFLTTTVPPAAPATTKAPTVTTALFPPVFDETTSGTSLEKMVSTSALPDFSASFQAPDVRTEGDGIFSSTELILLPEAPRVKTTTMGRTSISTSHFRTTASAPQETPDLQAATWAAVPSAAPATTMSSPAFDETTSNNFLEKMVTSALPEFSTNFQTTDAWTENEGVFCSTEPTSPPEVTTEFPSILLTADATEEANTSLLTDDVPAVATAPPAPTTLQTPKLTLGPSEASLSSAINTEKAGMKFSFPISTILSVSLIGISVILMLILLSLLWKRRHTRKFIMKSLRPAEDLEKVFSGSEGENNLFVL